MIITYQSEQERKRKMKRIICVLLAIIALFFVACSNVSQGTGDHEADNKTTHDASSMVEYKQPNNVVEYSFKSYKDLYDAMSDSDASSYKILHDAENLSRFNENGQESFVRMIELLDSKRIKLMIPEINESPMKISNDVEWQSITVFSCELHNLPWIWYYCDYQGHRVVIGMTYTDIIDKPGVNECRKYDELLDVIAPEFPNPNTDLSTSESYSYIDEIELIINGGEMIPAVVYRFAGEGGRTHYRFLYGNCILSVWSYDGKYKLTEEFFESFSLKPVTYGND